MIRERNAFSLRRYAHDELPGVTAESRNRIFLGLGIGVVQADNPLRSDVRPDSQKVCRHRHRRMVGINEHEIEWG